MKIFFFLVLKLLFNDILQGFSIFQGTSDGTLVCIYISELSISQA